MRRLFLLVLLLGCHREVRQEVHTAETATVNTAKATDILMAETKTEAPSEVDINTVREDDAVVIETPTGVEVVRVPRGAPLRLPPGARVAGTVRLATVTRTEDRHIGAVVDNKTTENKSTTTVAEVRKSTSATKTDTVTDAGPGLRFYAFLLLAAVAVLAAGYVYLKFIRGAVWP